MDANLYPTRDRTFVYLYFDTGKDAPYIKYHYNVKISLAYPSEAESFVHGKFKLSLYGSLGQLIDVELTSKAVKYVHGTDTYTLYVDDLNVGRIQRVELQWHYDASILDPGSHCGIFCNDHVYVSSVEISELNNYPEQSRLSHTFKACVVGSPYADIGDRKRAEFYPTACPSA